MNKWIISVYLSMLAMTCFSLYGQNRNTSIAMKFGDTIGLGTKFNQGQSLEFLPMLTDLGVKWVRDSELWSTVEKSPGNFQFSQSLLKRLAFYRENDIGVVFLAAYGNEIVYPDDEFSPEHYSRYVVEVARLLEAQDVRYVIELWNEPHNFGLKKLGGNWHGGPPSPWLDQYMEMVRAATKAVKQAVPHANVIIGPGTTIANYWATEDLPPQQIDGVAIHPYAHGKTSGPEMRHYDNHARWVRPFNIIDEQQSFRSVVELLGKRYEETVGHPVDFWATESGYSIGKVQYVTGATTEELAAALLPRLYINSAGSGVRAMFWYCSQDMPGAPGSWGLLSSKGEKRLTYTALKTLSSTLGESKMIRQLSGADDTTSGLQAYLFENEGNFQIAAWFIDGEAEISISPLADSSVSAVTHLNDSIAIGPSIDGVLHVNLGIAPVYFSGVDKDVTIRVLRVLNRLPGLETSGEEIDDHLIKLADIERIQALPEIQAFQEELNGGLLVGQIAGEADNRSGIQAYLFEVGMGYVVVAWNPSEESRVVIRTGSSFPLRVMSADKSPVRIDNRDNSAATIVLGPEPVFISGVEDDVEVQTYALLTR